MAAQENSLLNVQKNLVNSMNNIEQNLVGSMDNVDKNVESNIKNLTDYLLKNTIVVKKTKIRVIGSFSKGISQFIFGYSDFVNKVAELSNNSIEFEFTNAADIGENGVATIESVRRGTYDLTVSDASYGPAAYTQGLTWDGKPVQEIKSSFGLLGNARPFGMSADKYISFRVENDDIIQKEVNKYNLVEFPLGSSAGQITGYLGKPEDVESYKKDPIKYLNGKNIRVGGLSAKVYQEFGASTVVTPASVIAPGLEDGTFNMAEFVNTRIDPAIGLPGKSSGLVLTTWGECAPVVSLIFNKDFYDGLSTTTQNIIKTAAVYNCSLTTSKNIVESKESLDKVYKPLIDSNKLENIDLSLLKTTYNGIEENALDVLKSKWEVIQNKEYPDDPFWQTYTEIYQERLNIHATYTDLYVEKSGIIAG